jgi:alpha-beta hydrolase superfamily lysophospholipase
MLKRGTPEFKRYWEDQEWALDHYAELVEKYRDQWVAIVNKQVVAASKDSIKEIERTAQEKTGVEHIPVILVEGGDHVY